MTTDYTKKYKLFLAYKNRVQKLVRGIKIKLGEDTLQFELSIKQRVNDILALSDDPKTSIIAIRDAEYLIADIEEVMFTIGVVKAEIKEVVERSKGDKDVYQYGSKIMKEIKDSYGTVCDYFDVVKHKFSMVTQLIESLRSMNSMLRTRLDRDINNMWVSRGA